MIFSDSTINSASLLMNINQKKNHLQNALYEDFETIFSDDNNFEVVVVSFYIYLVDIVLSSHC